MASDLKFIVKGEGLSQSHKHLSSSHIHRKSGNIWETVLNRDVVTTGH